MRREITIFTISSIIAIGMALLVFRFIEPQLFGKPIDLTITHSSETQPDFFEAVFHFTEGMKGEDMLISDPQTIIRGQSFYPNLAGSGPHDAIGFRNEALPWRADLLLLGDSQTYGIGVPYEKSWPYLVKEKLQESFQGVYSAALGGFSVAQYNTLFPYLTRLRPTHALIALYTGNDLIETFRATYALDSYASYRKPNLSLENLPKLQFPPPTDSQETVTFRNGYSTIFTPQTRLSALNLDNLATKEGLALTRQLLSDMASEARQKDITLLITIIPTKEFLHQARILKEGIAMSEAMQSLANNESLVLQELKEFLLTSGQFEYIDIAPLLSEAIEKGAALYKSNDDGHPNAAGYQLISEILSSHLQAHAVTVEDGWYHVTQGSSEIIVRKKGSEMFLLQNESELAALGLSKKTLPKLSPSVFMRFPLRGVIKTGNTES